jgi:hypothetical protein
MKNQIERWASLGIALIVAGCFGCSSFGDGPECKFSPDSLVTYASEAELEVLLIGRWQRCKAPQVPGEDVGVEFAVDGKWYPLTHDAGGAVVRQTGIAYGGPWQYLPPGEPNVISGQPDPRGQFLLNGAYTDPPLFTDGPRQLRVNFSPVQSIYAPLP